MKIVGLDFDNTLIDYDLIFYKTALDYKFIPEHLEKSKISVRNYLVSKGLEKKFTFLQGEVYGSQIKFANKAEGVLNALKKLKDKGYLLFIVSHKTKYPISGSKYDLHQNSLDWLENNEFMCNKGLDIKRENIFFEPTKEKKIDRISQINCQYFIDDLSDILKMIKKDIIKIHYNKYQKFIKDNNIYSIKNWRELDSLNIF